MTILSHIGGPAVSVALVLFLIASPASAQDNTAPGSDQDCTVPHDDRDAADEDRSASGDDQELSKKLSDCGGVLQPPKAGDPELVKPAPDEGKTPVIPPKDMPDKQQNDESQAK